jgi:hypothetical protein
MDSASKGHMTNVLTPDVEPVRVIIDGWVAIGGTE